MASTSAAPGDAALKAFAVAVKWQGKQFTVNLSEVPFKFIYPRFKFPSSRLPLPPSVVLKAILRFVLSQDADVGSLKRGIEVREHPRIVHLRSACTTHTLTQFFICT